MSAVGKLQPTHFPKAPTFPVGYVEFCPEPNMNFQLNRCYAGLGESSRADLLEVGKRIDNFADFKRELLALSDRALAAGKKINAASYLRFAEFFVSPCDPDKVRIYEAFMTLVDDAYPEMALCRVGVPYEGKQLSAVHLRPDGPVRDILVMHGGFDSFLEELFPYMLAVREQGYEVIAFEGPGQGAALKRQNLALIHDWERPVAAVLDHFKLREITLVGISLGGYLALRASAFEPRIKRVIAYDICYDFFDAAMASLPAPARALIRLAVRLGARGLLNSFIKRRMKVDLLASWGIRHGMYVCGVNSPFDFLSSIMRLSMRELSHLVRQDVLLLAGQDDHLIPFAQFGQQMQALTHARSLTGRVFTAKEHGAQHCQLANTGLALNVIDGWLRQFN